MSRRIQVFDTTLRDGEQSPGCSMNLHEKVRMARQLERLGADIIEAGFPVASRGEFLAVEAVSAELESATVAALCRTRKKDIDRAWAAVRRAKKPRIHTFIATSEIHMHHKLSMTPGQVLQAIKEMVSLARSYCDDVEFSAEDASRSDLSFLLDTIQTAIEAGATTINLPDTVGYATPGEYGHLFAEVQRQIPESRQVCLSAHCHNDLGLAVANSLAAIENGAGQVECTVNGIGERAGNAALEEIVMALYVRQERFEATTGVISQEIHSTSQLLSEITSVQVQPHKAIVGENAFAHEAGIHQDGVLKNSLTYEIMTPESVGLTGNNLVLGKHSGRHALKDCYSRMDIEVTDVQLEEIYLTFLEMADRQKTVRPAELMDIWRQHQRAGAGRGYQAFPSKPGQGAAR